MKREMLDTLTTWKESSNKKSLLLLGARQVGKTYLVRQFGNECYKNFIEINFEFDLTARTIFDSDLNRNYVECLNRNFQQMPHIYPLGETRFRLPETLIKKFKIEVCNENHEVSEKSYENHLRFVTIAVNQTAKWIRLIPEETWGADSFRIFSVEPV